MQSQGNTTKKHMARMDPVPPIPTGDSVAAALRHQREERAKVEAATGVRITDAPFDAYTIVCPRCLVPCGGDNEGQANRVFARHYVTAHVAQLPVGA